MIDHTTSVPLETERELAPLLWAKALDDGDIVIPTMIGSVGPLDTTRGRSNHTPAGPRGTQFTRDCRWIEGDPSVLLLAAVA